MKCSMIHIIWSGFEERKRVEDDEHKRAGAAIR